MNLLQKIGLAIKNAAVKVWHDIVENHGKEFVDEAIVIAKSFVQVVENDLGFDGTPADGAAKRERAISMLIQWGKVQGKNLLYHEAEQFVVTAFGNVFGAKKVAESKKADTASTDQSAPPSSGSTATPAQAASNPASASVS